MQLLFDLQYMYVCITVQNVSGSQNAYIFRNISYVVDDVMCLIWINVGLFTRSHLQLEVQFIIII